MTVPSSKSCQSTPSHPWLRAHPLAQALGCSLAIEEGKARVAMPFSQQVLGDLGAVTLHLGAIASCLFAAADAQVRLSENIELPCQLAMQSIELLRTTSPHPLVATAKVWSESRELICAEALAWLEDGTGNCDTPIARAMYRFRRDLPTYGGSTQ